MLCFRYTIMANSEIAAMPLAESLITGSSLEHGKNTSMYTCGTRVKMPKVGDDGSVDLDIMTPHPPQTPQDKPSTAPPNISESFSANYVKKISTDLKFADEVVEDRCMAKTAYNDKYFYQALDASNIISEPPKINYTLARHNKRGPDTRHQSCHLQKRVPYKLKPLKRKILEKAAEMHKQAMQKEFEEYMKQQEEIKIQELAKKKKEFFLTQQVETKPIEPQKDEWDKYLMSLISGTTAQWIVSKKTEPGARQVNCITYINLFICEHFLTEYLKSSATKKSFTNT